MARRNGRGGATAAATPEEDAGAAHEPTPEVAGDVVIDDEVTCILGADGGSTPVAAAYPVAVETLTGDLRDFVLDRLRHEQDKRPWNERSEADQKQTIKDVEAAARDVVARAVDLIAAAGRRTIKAKLAQVLIKDGVKAQLEILQHDELRHVLYDAVGSRVLVVVADPEAFTGERAPAEVTPDQADLVRAAAMAVHSAPNGHGGDMVAF